MPYWIINTGQCYGTDEGGFVESFPESAQKLYSRNTLGEPVIADKECLRSTLLFYGFTIPASLQTVVEKQTAIQEAYTSQLQHVLQSITSAQILTPDADLSELTAYYITLRNEMRDKINEVEYNG